MTGTVNYATGAPTWTDSDQGDLLELVAQGSATGAADHEWGLYVEALRTVAVIGAGDIDPNQLRSRVRGLIAPKRLGAFVSRAVARDLVRFDGQWVTSTDTEGRNAGRPCRVLTALPGLWAAGAPTP